ncbi:hypothetical protein RGI145_16970 [Roseomonas gilardii]|uniref:Uncharacterized protein n=1 Tax=Roseomonas gilardii TaxID=257708 RepID=A0A1L7AIN4_9PROT|nr:hypothetical protein [Roseomonas gilardii]APT58549.1 hypothetical protein RGI145_16970 [Roseomonas gilardii]
MLSLVALLASPEAAPYFTIADATINLALLIVALTPTQKDDDVVNRIKNLFTVVRAAVGR